MLQIVASANSVYNIPWPTSFSAFLEVMKVFLVDIITITKVRRGPWGYSSTNTWKSSEAGGATRGKPITKRPICQSERG
jgi:hypothetical protein